jgi:hypothetical protein
VFLGLFRQIRFVDDCRFHDVRCVLTKKGYRGTLSDAP